MVKVHEKYIVRKDGKWLKSSRPDIISIQIAHLFSEYLYDAKEFTFRRDAKRTAAKVGGEVWSFVRVTGEHHLVWRQPPADAKCDTCSKWTPFDGVCRNQQSENYREPVSMEDVCDEWEDKCNG